MSGETSFWDKTSPVAFDLCPWDNYVLDEWEYPQTNLVLCTMIWALIKCDSTVRFFCLVPLWRSGITTLLQHEWRPVSPGQTTSVTCWWYQDGAGRRWEVSVNKMRWVWCESSCWTRSTVLQQRCGPFVQGRLAEAAEKRTAVQLGWCERVNDHF